MLKTMALLLTIISMKCLTDGLNREHLLLFDVPTSKKFPKSRLIERDIHDMESLLNCEQQHYVTLIRRRVPLFNIFSHYIIIIFLI